MNEKTEKQATSGSASSDFADSVMDGAVNGEAVPNPLPPSPDLTGMELPPVPPDWTQQLPKTADQLQAEAMMPSLNPVTTENEAPKPKKRFFLARVLLTVLLLAVIVVSIIMIIWQPWDRDADPAGDQQGAQQTTEPTIEPTEVIEPVEVVEPTDPNLAGVITGEVSDN